MTNQNPSNDIISWFKQGIQEEIERLKETLELGVCSTYDEYKYLVGQIQGLKQSRDILTIMIKKRLDDDDEENE